MNDFTTIYNQLVANIQKLSTNVNTLQRVVNKLGTSEDNSHLRSHLKSLESETNHLAKQSSKDIQQLSRLPTILDTNQSIERRVLCQKVRNDFIEILNKFKEIQINATKKVKENRIAVNNTNNPFLSNDEYNFESTTLSFKEETPFQTQQQLSEEEERNRLKSAQEQNEAIRQLESDIVDVNQIFTDLAQIVHGQQDVLDNIERNIDNTDVRIESGAQELRSAAEYQAKARKKRLMIVIIFAFILTILTLIIYFSVNK